MIKAYKNQDFKLLKGYQEKFWRGFLRWAAAPWFAYITILLLQLKRIWGAWQYRDLTSGDTSSYFMNAYGWAQEFSVNIAWSPLYTAYYGMVFKLVPDVYWATLIHRFLIVFVLAVMVLALMRRLLPSHIAWLIAAWWVVLPINFNSLYEVHLFAVLLPLMATLFVLSKPGIWTRGTALGILLVTMVLVRNEIIIAVCLWVFFCLVWEVRQIRLRCKKSFMVYLIAYGMPVLFAALVFSFFSWRTLIKPTPEDLRRKHTLNVCQIYAFGYQQRHSDWRKSPWTECQELMLQVFGAPEPSMIEALQSNPPAMLRHFLWNIRLLPAGLQVSLFNATSDRVNPDYSPVQLDRLIILIPSLFGLGLFVIGFVQLYREKSYWWTTWLNNRIWGWIMLFCLAAVMLIVIPMQRPRPSYMFLLTLFLMTILGMCVFLWMRRLLEHPGLAHLFPAIVIIVLLFVPQYYSAGQLPLLKLYRELESSEEFIGIPGTGIVVPGYSQELCNYFTQSSRAGCFGYGYGVFQDFAGSESVSELLGFQSLPVVVLLIDDDFLTKYSNEPVVQNFLTDPELEGWKLVALQDNSKGNWRLYVNVSKLNVIAPELPITLSPN